MLEIVKNPKHGFGKNLNPCVDCRISMLRRAVAFAREIGADFVVSGEVVGQRPMSQRLDAMRLIDKEAEVEGLVVRPLCGKLLPATKAEKDGLIDREKLLDLRGRSRKPQMELARKFGLVEYPSPAGGCLLTEAHFARRMRDLLEHGEPDINDVGLLKSGRHFRLDEKTKAVIGKDDEDNKRIAALARKGDTIITTVDVPGPTTLVRGEASERNVEIAARLTARYSQGRAAESVTLAVSAFGEEKPSTLRVKPAALDEFREMLIE
jgi:tRNA U34 2-thiouridine synthase MnmA/TrmU